MFVMMLPYYPPKTYMQDNACVLPFSDPQQTGIKWDKGQTVAYLNCRSNKVYETKFHIYYMDSK